MPISTINQAGLSAPLTLTSPVLTTPNLGTPSALVLTNATGTPASINLSNATALPKTALPTGSVVNVANTFSVGPVSIANSGNGRVYADLLTISYTPISASNKIILLGTSGFSSFSSRSAVGAFGVTFNVNGTEYEFGNYPWYNGNNTYPNYPPDTSISRTLSVPTGSAFNIKFRGFSYNEASGTMTPQFINYQLTVIEVAA
jgi:hypothetical protein